MRVWMLMCTVRIVVLGTKFRERKRNHTCAKVHQHLNVLLLMDFTTGPMMVKASRSQRQILLQRHQR